MIPHSHGRKPPALVFIHGAGSNAGFWHEQRDDFPIAHFLNLPGHTDARDRVGAGEGIGTVEGYAKWVAEYIERAGWQRVVLNGHSMGGAIALALALQHPLWLSGIVLTGTGARLRVSPQLLALLRTDYPAAVDRIVTQSFAPSDEPQPYARKVRLNGTRRQILRTPPEVTLGDYLACHRFDVLDRLSEIDVPALCVVGAQDSMAPPEYSQYMHSHIPLSRLAIVEGAGHMLPLEQPVEYNTRVAEFLGSLYNEAV